MMHARPLRPLLPTLLMLLALQPETRVVEGQQRLQAPGGSPNFALPMNPELAAAVGSAELAISQQQWDRALEILQLLLDSSQDAFSTPASGITVRDQIDAQFNALPAEVRRQYERRHEAAAKALLEQGTATGDRAILRELVRRYGHTPSGRAAAWRLARQRQDQGDALSAALLYERLLQAPESAAEFGPELKVRAAAAWCQAGDHPRALARLAELQAAGLTKITAAGGTLELPGPDESPADWLARLCGRIVTSPDVPAPPEAQTDAAATSAAAVPAFALPLSGADWRAPPLDADDTPYPERIASLCERLQGLQQQMRGDAAAGRRILIPAAVPVAVGGRLLVAGPDKLRSFRLADGTLDWPAVHSDASFQELVLRHDFPDRESLTRELLLGQRIWRDRTVGSVTTDRQRAYVVMSPGMCGAVDPALLALLGGQRTAKGPQRENFLHAYQVQGGKLHWAIGGPLGPADNEFSGLYFLGPPLPHEGLLYVLAEDRGLVRLLAIDPTPAARPVLVWSQPLLHVPPDLAVDRHEERRTAALTPLATGGVLLCPTGAGTVIAVDIDARRLLWSRQYYNHVEFDQREQMIRQAMRQRESLQVQQRQALDRLLDELHWRGPGRPYGTGEYALLTTPERHGLICLRWATGEVQWESTSEQRLYVAALHRERAIVVGISQIEALRLADGQPDWPAPIPIPPPSGLGVQHGDLYTLPLATGELATIDLASGRMLVRSPLPEGRCLGNLTVAQGRLIEWSALGLQATPALTSADRQPPPELAAATSDPGALARRGELRLHAGDIAGGRADLRAALQQLDDPRLRRVLASSLLEDLRLDFTVAARLAPELDRLVAGTPEEAPYRRRLALGLQAAGDRTAAMEQYLLLSGLSLSDQELEPLDPELSVATSRWIEAQLRSLLAEASAAEHAAMLAILQQRLAASGPAHANASATLSLTSLLRLLRGTDLEQAALLAAARGATGLTTLQQEALWLEVEALSDPQLQAEALARLTELYLTEKNVAAAAPRLARLRTEFRDVVCLPDRTGAQLVAAWEHDPKHAFTLAEAVVPIWPQGPIKVTTAEGELPTLGRNVSVQGKIQGPLSGWSFRFDESHQRLSAYTPLGRFGWEVQLGQSGSGESVSPRCVMAQGHLVMVVFDERFWLVNALDATSVRFRRVLAGQTLVEAVSDSAPFAVQARRGRMGGRIGLVGPLRPDVIVFSQGDQLIALDPWTAQVVWKRTYGGGVAEILADEEYTVVRSYGTAESLVLRSVDGAVVARVKLGEDFATRPVEADWGRLLLSLGRPASPDGTARRASPTPADAPAAPPAAAEVVRLGMFDPVTSQFVWQRDVARPFWHGVIDGGNLAIATAQGDFLLLDPVTGRPLIETRLGDGQPAGAAAPAILPRQPEPAPGAEPPPDVGGAQSEPELANRPARASPFESLTLLADEQRVFVVLNRPQDPDVVRFNRRLTSEQPLNGRLFALDRATGQTLWSREIAGQYTDPFLPAAWPFLVLSAVQTRPGAETPEHRVVILGRGHGELLHEYTAEVPGVVGSRLRSKTGWLADAELPIARLAFGPTLMSIDCQPAPDKENTP